MVLICSDDYHESVALSYHNGTTTPYLPLSLPVPLEELNPDKSAVLSPRVPPCRPLSLSENDYESEGRRFESCRARHRNTSICRGNAATRKRRVRVFRKFDRDLTVAQISKPTQPLVMLLVNALADKGYSGLQCY